MISFIVPAHNEEALIGRTLAALHESAGKLREEYEIIVANDASTDRTGSIALEQGARVVDVNHRQIAPTRNAGARAAKGEIFIFVDADTVITAGLLRGSLRALRRGAVGGGCTIRIDGRLPTNAVVMERVLRVVQPIIGLAGGCFLFCTRQSYLATGGFDATLFVTEEVDFGNRLKRQGRFVILRECAITSGRKLRTHSAMDLLRIGLRLARGGRKALQRREGLEYWYGPRGIK
jgi:glycosyltransferase involved in cell wall biosynthesis